MRRISLILTSKCNQHCKYCFEQEVHNNIQKVQGKYSLKENIQFIKTAENVSSITLTGGEPMLYPELELLLDKFQQNHITLLTNGVEKFRGKKALLKNVNVVISLDGNQKVMRNNRRTSKKAFCSILKNIEWYILYAKTVTLHTVLTPYNINEDSFFPYERYGESIQYEISVPSMAYTPKQLQILPMQYIKVLQLVMRYEEKYHYHMKCVTNIFRKHTFESNIRNIIEGMIGIEYLLESNNFRLLNEYYATLDDALNAFPKKSAFVKKILCEYLDGKSDSYLFDPYSLAEWLLYCRNISY